MPPDGPPPKGCVSGPILATQSTACFPRRSCARRNGRSWSSTGPGQNNYLQLGTAAMPATPSTFDDRIARWKQEMDLPWARLKYKLAQSNLARPLPHGSMTVLDVAGVQW